MMLGKHFYWFVFLITIIIIISAAVCEISDAQTTFNEAFPILNEVRDNIYLIEHSRITPKELIERHGYPYEEHQIITEDGYILTMHRIPYGQYGPSDKRYPILIQHGLESSSAEWVVTGPKNAIGFKLADAGYDVWLCNSRGNAFSRKHVKLDPDNSTQKAKFFDFTFDEMGRYDLPAQIDYVLKVTGFSQVFCFAHSLGTAVFFVMASVRPEYNSKVKAFFSAGTSIYLEHMTSGVRIPLTAVYFLRDVLDSLHVYEIFSHDQFINGFDVWCSQNSPLFYLCGAVINELGGANYGNWNYTAQPEILQNFPAGTSSYTCYHCGQISIPGSKFRPYSYGLQKNLQKYGTLYPSEYPLWKVSVPVYIHICSNDAVNHPLDALHGAADLPNVKSIVTSDCNHIEYMWGMNTSKAFLNYFIFIMDSLR